MGTSFDCMTEESARIAAGQLARLHANLGGDYQAVVLAVVSAICQQGPANNDFYDCFLENRIRNYCDLAAAQLNALTAAPGTPMRQTLRDSGESIGRQLRAQGIPEEFISGNNAGLMEGLVRELRRA